MKPASRNIDDTRSDVAESMPLSTSGVAIGRSSAPICEPADAGQPERLHVGGAIGERGDARVVGADGGGEALRRDGQLEPRLRAASPRRAPVSAVASIISAIGVMPAIGSFGNAPMEYETAPMRRPSM